MAFAPLLAINATAIYRPVSTRSFLDLMWELHIGEGAFADNIVLSAALKLSYIFL